MARLARKIAGLGIAALVLATWCRQAGAAELYAGDGLEVRWNNTLRYTAAARLEGRSAALLGDRNADDGDRNFAPGLVSDRFDLLSELNIIRGDFGLRASAAAWFDTVYQTGAGSSSPATNNSTLPGRRFAPALRTLQGQHAELNDALAYGNFTLGQMPVSLRAGRQTLLAGESRFFDPNSIEAAMAPADYLKLLTDQDGYSGNMFLPVTQASLTFQPLPWLSVSLYDQFEWRASRQPGDGAFLSYVDYLGAGAARLFLAPDKYLVRGPDRRPTGRQFGITLRGRAADIDWGLYALRFSAKDPNVVLVTDPAFPAATGAAGYYYLAYKSDIELYGASFSTELGASSLAGEFSVRRNAPLGSYNDPSSLHTDLLGGGYHRYTIADIWHSQISIDTALAGSSLWDRADATVEIATDDILDLASPAESEFSRFAMKARARLEPHYFQVLPNLDVTGIMELGYNVTGRGFTYYAQNGGTGDFRLGVSATYLSTWKLGLIYTGFLGRASRQPLADRGFATLSLERTF